MMKYADSWHAQHSSKQLRWAGQAPALNIFTLRTGNKTLRVLARLKG